MILKILVGEVITVVITISLLQKRNVYVIIKKMNI